MSYYSWQEVKHVFCGCLALLELSLSLVLLMISVDKILRCSNADESV